MMQTDDDLNYEKNRACELKLYSDVFSFLFLFLNMKYEPVPKQTKEEFIHKEKHKNVCSLYT